MNYGINMVLHERWNIYVLHECHVILLSCYNFTTCNVISPNLNETKHLPVNGIQIFQRYKTYCSFNIQQLKISNTVV